MVNWVRWFKSWPAGRGLDCRGLGRRGVQVHGTASTHATATAAADPANAGVDDFALKRRHRYATILTDAETGELIDVLPGRGADALETGLRTHPGVELVCRDGSGAYGEAVRRALPDAVQVVDRWHLWKRTSVTRPSLRSVPTAPAGPRPTRPAGIREQTTRERWQQTHDLLDKGVGLPQCARRLNLSLQHRQTLGPAGAPRLGWP